MLATKEQLDGLFTSQIVQGDLEYEAVQHETGFEIHVLEVEKGIKLANFSETFEATDIIWILHVNYGGYFQSIQYTSSDRSDGNSKLNEFKNSLYTERIAPDFLKELARETAKKFDAIEEALDVEKTLTL